MKFSLSDNIDISTYSISVTGADQTHVLNNLSFSAGILSGSFVTQEVVADTTFTVNTQASDSAGNSSNTLDSNINFNVTNDNPPSAVAFTAPTVDQRIVLSGSVVSLEITASDLVQMKKVFG